MEKKKQPKGLYLLGSLMMCSNFGYYGSRIVMLLFMVAGIEHGGLGLMNAQGASILATYMALAYLTPMLGGWLADNILGFRKTTLIGFILCTIGYFTGFVYNSINGIYIMTGLVALGAGLYKGNLLNLLGLMYDEDEESLKDAGFSIVYSYINVGIFIGTLVCGLIATKWMATFNTDGSVAIYGYKYVFLTTSMVLLLATILLSTLQNSCLNGKGIKPLAAKKKNGIKEPLTEAEKKNVLVICIVSFVASFFWIAYYQNALSVVLYARNHIQLTYGGFEIPLTWMDTLNAILCVVLAGVFAKFWQWKATTKNGDFNMATKITIGFVLLASSFALMAVSMLQTIGGGKASILWLIGFIVLMTMGELSFSPIAYSMVDKLAPSRLKGLMMSVFFLSVMVASKLSGYVQLFVEKMGALEAFISIVVYLLVIAGILFSFNKKLEQLEKEGKAKPLNV